MSKVIKCKVTLKKSIFKQGLILIAILLTQACSTEDEIIKPSTASSNVKVLTQTFLMPGLERERILRIYLPPNYQTETKHYPVIYMHDAQNLFDDATSYIGEWHVDETLNKLHQEVNLSVIVVGIDNGQEKRMNELSPWENSEFGIAEGEQYMEFIVNIVKPNIDKNYRTLNDQKNTAIMGSSMGGLISHYAIFNYPHIFSKAGIYSPSYWYADQVFNFSDVNKLSDNSKLYILVGDKEGADMVDNVEKMSEHLLNNHFNGSHLRTKIVKGGEHNENFWSSEFEETIKWLFIE